MKVTVDETIHTIDDCASVAAAFLFRIPLLIADLFLSQLVPGYTV